jgi:signal transduction histidine kinase
MTALLGFAPSLRMDGRLDEAGPGAAAVEHLLAVLREALSNVARHANATRADVAIVLAEAGHGRELELTVRDDGDGIKPSSRRSGLANMADRATALGGTLTAEPADGGGTVLEWRVPLPAGQ